MYSSLVQNLVFAVNLSTTNSSINCLLKATIRADETRSTGRSRSYRNTSSLWQSNVLASGDLQPPHSRFKKSFAVLTFARIHPIGHNSFSSLCAPPHTLLFHPTRDHLSVSTGSSHFPVTLCHLLFTWVPNDLRTSVLSALTALTFLVVQLSAFFWFRYSHDRATAPH